MDYCQAWDLQRYIAQGRAHGTRIDTVLFLEHLHTYTLGRRGRPTDLLLPRETLEWMGARVVDVDRGGEITFHSPGQLVGYPIINLRGWGGPMQYVRALEAAIISALGLFGIEAGRIDGLTGVWTHGAKLAAIGVRVSQGITTHGFALNINNDLSWFRHIIPCGIHDRKVISMQQLLGKDVSLEEVAAIMAESIGDKFGFRMAKVTPEAVIGSWSLPSMV